MPRRRPQQQQQQRGRTSRRPHSRNDKYHSNDNDDDHDDRSHILEDDDENNDASYSSEEHDNINHGSRRYDPSMRGGLPGHPVRAAVRYQDHHDDDDDDSLQQNEEEERSNEGSDHDGNVDHVDRGRTSHQQHKKSKHDDNKEHDSMEDPDPEDGNDEDDGSSYRGSDAASSAALDESDDKDDDDEDFDVARQRHKDKIKRVANRQQQPDRKPQRRTPPQKRSTARRQGSSTTRSKLQSRPMKRGKDIDDSSFASPKEKEKDDNNDESSAENAESIPRQARARGGRGGKPQMSRSLSAVTSKKSRAAQQSDESDKDDYDDGNRKRRGKNTPQQQRQPIMNRSGRAQRRSAEKATRNILRYRDDDDDDDEDDKEKGSSDEDEYDHGTSGRKIGVPQNEPSHGDRVGSDSDQAEHGKHRTPPSSLPSRRKSPAKQEEDEDFVPDDDDDDEYEQEDDDNAVGDDGNSDDSLVQPNRRWSPRNRRERSSQNNLQHEFIASTDEDGSEQDDEKKSDRLAVGHVRTSDFATMGNSSGEDDDEDYVQKNRAATQKSRRSSSANHSPARGTSPGWNNNGDHDDADDDESEIVASQSGGNQDNSKNTQSSSKSPLKLPPCPSEIDAITQEPLPACHVCFVLPDQSSRQCFTLDTLHRIAKCSGQPLWRRNAVLGTLQKTFLQPPHFRTAMSDDLLDQIASRFGRDALDLDGPYYDKNHPIHHLPDEISTEAARAQQKHGIRNQLDNDAFFNRVSTYVRAFMGNKDLYCCPLCYSEAYRRLSSDDDSTVNFKNQIRGRRSQVRPSQVASSTDIATLYPQQFRHDPMLVLGHIDRGHNEVAATFCFERVAQMKEHLREDHKVDTRHVDQDLYTKFKIRAQDGLLQRWLKLEYRKAHQGYMQQYWFAGNNFEYVLLLEMVAKAARCREILADHATNLSNQEPRRHNAATAFLNGGWQYFDTFRDCAAELWQYLSSPYNSNDDLGDFIDNNADAELEYEDDEGRNGTERSDHAALEMETFRRQMQEEDNEMQQHVARYEQMASRRDDGDEDSHGEGEDQDEDDDVILLASPSDNGIERDDDDDDGSSWASSKLQDSTDDDLRGAVRNQRDSMDGRERRRSRLPPRSVRKGRISTTDREGRHFTPPNDTNGPDDDVKVNAKRRRALDDDEYDDDHMNNPENSSTKRPSSSPRKRLIIKADDVGDEEES